MNKCLMHRLALFLVANILFISSSFASDGIDGTATASFSAGSLTIGEPATLSVEVVGMTNGKDGGTDGSCKYTITIPDDITTVIKSQTSLTNDLPKKGASGNGTYQHGIYTSNTVGCYNFGLAVSKGTNGNNDKAGTNNVNIPACFHPKTPVAVAATDPTPYGFTANWEAESSAESYLITVTKTGDPDEVVHEDVEVDSEENTILSHTFGGLEPNTEYFYTVKSKAKGLVSVGASEKIYIETDGPKINIANELELFEIALGHSTNQIITITASNLYGDVSLSVEGGASSPFSIDRETISQEDDENQAIPVKITYSSELINIHTDKLIISSTYLYKEIPLTGKTSTEIPEAQEATEVDQYSFMANWTKVDYATKYFLTVTGPDEEIIYEDFVGDEASYKLENLTAASEYTYTVQAWSNEILSPASDVINVRTLNMPDVEIDGNLEPYQIIVHHAGDQAILLTPTDLCGDISLSFKGGENSSFQVDKSLINKDNHDPEVEITITYDPQLPGTNIDTLVISSCYYYKEIELLGIATTEIPEALDATDEHGSGFTANWEEVDYATDYFLIIKDFADEIKFEGYVGNVSFYVMENLLPENKYTYTVQAFSNDVLSEFSNEIEVLTPQGPVITYSQPASFAQEVNTEVSKTIRVVGTNLIDVIEVEIEDDNDYFSINVSELEKTGGKVVVTFNPESVGVFTANLILSSSTLEKNVVVELEGTSLPVAVAAKEASDINDLSFTANWTKSPDAIDYKLTVKNGNTIVLDGIRTGDVISYEVPGLTPGTVYNYSIVVVTEDGLESTPSNLIEAVTHTAPQPVTTAENMTSIRVEWPETIGAENYIVSLFNGEEPVMGYDELEITENGISFAGLTPNTEYTYQISSVFGESQYDSELKTAKTINAYGEQIENLGFEYWEGSDTGIEPVSWNSFMTAEAVCGLCGLAKSQQVKQSTAVVRPGSNGSSSALIWSRNAVVATANGNLTTGQIVAGSTTAADNANHNITRTGNEEFNQQFTGQPDSLTVWVKYMPKKATDEARISAVIHDDYDYRDPSGSDSNAPGHVVATAIKNYGAAENNNWQRLAIPFDYSAGPATNPKYILISFTTNKDAGKGSANDTVYIDDLLFVYAPTLTAGALSKSQYKRGDRISLPYTLTGTMSANNLNADPNVVKLQLSDADGSFENAVILAEITTDQSGLISANLPLDLPLGDNYQVRVVTTNYPLTSEPSETVFRVCEIPAAPVALNETALTSASFIANWEPVEGITGYILTVNGKTYQVDADKISYPVAGLTPETRCTYFVQAVDGDLISEVSNSITFVTTDGGVINYEGDKNFETENNVAVSQLFTITAVGLVNEVTAQITSLNAAYFNIQEPYELTTEGGSLTVFYSPDAIGEHAAILSLKSDFADNVNIQLKGINRPESTTTLEADKITPVSFTANWNESLIPGALYLLTVIDEDGNIVAGYDALNVGDVASYEVTELLPATTYFYSVIVQYNSINSAASATEEVETLAKPVINNVDAVAFDQENGTTDSETITVSGKNLAGEIESVLSFGSSYFSIDRESESNDIVITYAPQTIGKHTATITLSSLYAEDVEIELSGISRPTAVETLEADPVTPSSFVANWTESTQTGAVYLLTVTDKDGNTIAGYDAVEVNTTSYEVTELSPETTYFYSVIVQYNSINSAASATEEVETLAKPVINNVDAVAFDQENGTTDSETITVSGKNLAEEIESVLSFGSSYFSIDRESESNVVITYAPQTIGKHTATITLSSLYAENVEVELSGISRPAVVATLAADEITASSFIAKWNESLVAGASYLLTVTDEEGNIVEGYDALNVGDVTSYEVTSLSPETTYYYSVIVVVNEISSLPSDEKGVITEESGPNSIEQIFTDKNISIYPNPVATTLYVKGTTANKAIVYSVSGNKISESYLTENSINVQDLPAGIYFITIEDNEQNVYKMSFIKE